MGSKYPMSRMAVTSDTDWQSVVAKVSWWIWLSLFVFTSLFSQNPDWVDMEPAQFLEEIQMARTISIRDGRS